MVKVGAERSDVPLVWPTTLVRPTTRLVYLDLNQWIALAKADAGHPDGQRWQGALRSLRSRPAGWTFAIGLPLIMELTGIRQRRQSADLARVIEDLTFADAELALNRSVIRGPATDDEEQQLLGHGWDPRVAQRSAEARAQQERDQAVRLDDEPRWRRGRLRDVVAVQYFGLEMENVREEIFKAHGLRPADVFPTVESARAFTDSMPSGDVWITLRTAKHRNRSSVWKPKIRPESMSSRSDLAGQARSAASNAR